MMKTSARLFLTSLMLLACVAAAAAQKRACPVPPPSPFKHDGAIATSYDRAAGGMRTTLEHPRPIPTADGGLYLTASFLHRSANRPARLAMDVAFVSASKSAHYRDAHGLVFYADGREVPLGGAPAQYQTSKEHGLLLEATKVTIPYETLQTLIRARHVSARVGATQFELTNNHLEALRELASLMAPSPANWASASAAR